MTAILFLSLLLQQEETIPKAQKAVYLKAVKACDRAAASIENDPRGAIEVFDSILGNAKIKTREVRLRIETASGSYSRWYEFHPHQFRGRARLVLAKKAEDRESALNLLRLSERDFEKSVALGLDASKPYMDEIETERKRWKVATPPTDPEPQFRREWNALLAAGRFAEAKNRVQAKGGFLSAAKKRNYLSKTEEECRSLVLENLNRFLLRLENVPRPEEVASMGSAGFVDAFALPEKSDLVISSPTLDWCLAVRETLRLIRRREEVLDLLLAHAVASLPLVKKGENGWFRSVEKLAFTIVSDRLLIMVAEAKNAPASRRQTLRQEALALRKKWGKFESNAGRLSRKRDVASWEAKFPAEAEGIGKIPDEFFSCAEAANPLEAVLQVEERLREYRQGWDRLSIESRRSVVRYQIVAGALGHFLQGKTVAEATRGLRTLGHELKSLGGRVEEERFGPKVGRVFQGLR